MTAPSPAAAGLPAEDVERVARALWESCYGGTWDLTWEEFRDTPGADPDYYRRLAAAALAEMRPTAAEEAVKRVEARRCSRGYSEAEHWVDGYYSCPAALAPVPDDADGGERR